MPARFRRVLWPCVATLSLALGCVPTPEEKKAEGAVAPERPADSELVSLGPEKGARIYYQFVDEGGRVRFVERLEDVPERWRADAGFVETSSPPPLTPAHARAALAGRMESARSQRGAAAPKVLLYYADWCGYCRKAKAHLDRRGVPYEIRNVDVSSVKAELRAKTGRTGIPVLDVGGRILQGYRAESLDDMLDSAGF